MQVTEQTINLITKEILGPVHRERIPKMKLKCVDIVHGDTIQKGIPPRKVAATPTPS